MPTPVDAPYKVAQREREMALRGSRRLARIDRGRMVQVAAAAGRSAPQLDGEGAMSRVVLAKLRPLMSRAEQSAAGVLFLSLPDLPRKLSRKARRAAKRDLCERAAASGLVLAERLP